MQYLRKPKCLPIWAVPALCAIAFVGFLSSACTAQDKGKEMTQSLPSPQKIEKLPPDGGPEFNRLIHEKSPYLLQHARNPVDWYPWGEEAFARAKEEKKPIFLSVGYSSCHWCHVMEHESFEQDDVAKILNDHFISIKVDREERPDIDEIYMNATQVTTGRGGWPNSVWLTPDGRPWYAGTYFPPEDMYGRPGFKTILLRLTEIWRTRPQDVEAQAKQLSESLKRISSGSDVEGSFELDRDLVAETLDSLRQSFDAHFGGFGGAPKFPPHGGLNLLLYEYRKTKDKSLLRMATRTLDAMSQGGIHDHIGGGFHRYSTDEHWLVPHFEKMLYDNAQLARAYVDAYTITGNEECRLTALDTYEWVLREMTSKEGGFYSALDADSEGEEGKFYVWTRNEIISILGSEKGELFCRIFNIEEVGNFQEEATGRATGTNILHLTRSLSETAGIENIPIADLHSRLSKDIRKLLDYRNKRVWPHLDDKILTSWNGLMLGSLAYGGRHLNEPRYAAAAEKAANFILTTMRKNGRLLRSYRDGEAKLNAYLDDYAFLANGLLDLYEATANKRYLDDAKELVEVLLRHYRDAENGGFYFNSDDHEDLLTRSKDPYDKAIPSGNGMAARVLIRLGQTTKEPRYLEMARNSLETFLALMHRAPRGAESLVLATAMYFDEIPSQEIQQTEAEADAHLRKPPLTIEAFISQSTIAPSQIFHLALRISIDKGWHINSNTPDQDYLLPTTIELKQNLSAAMGNVDYPEGKNIVFDFSPDPMSVYEGTIWIKAPVTIAENAQNGPIELKLKIHTQACDNKACQAPTIHTIPIRVEVL
ncbi:MAG: DUF255 domain-containing protein [bacterium]